MTFNGKLGLVQRVLPVYRAPFFDALASACAGGLDVFAGEPRPDESIVSAAELKTAFWTRADNLHLLRGPLYLCYQRGLMDWLRDWRARRAHRGGEPSLPRDLLRGEVDASKEVAGHRVGTRVAASFWLVCRSPALCAPALPAPIRRADLLLGARRGAICRPRLSR